MSKEKKTPMQIALEKECIFLVVAEVFSQALRPAAYMEGAEPDVKCRGPKCAEFDTFNIRCGFSK